MMFNLLRKAPLPERSSLLAARPRRNELVRETQRTERSLRLTAPLRPGFMQRFLSRNANSKSFDLDALGIWVWDRVDGHQTVRTLIETFATEHRLNAREAEVSVLAFLKMLAQRNLIALVAPKIAHEATPRRKKKKRKK